MCGICGFTSKVTDQKKYLLSMMEPLQSRGPDAQGIFFNEKINLGHKRLSIIDMNERSNQPMVDNDTGIIIVFNGEIYNYIELKKKISEKFKCTFKTNSDTEVILKYYKYYGVKCFKEFDGMFAIGIWDPRNNLLILARDRFGEKPLYYSFFKNDNSSQISFSSNLNSLKKSPEFLKKLNNKSIKSYFENNYVYSNETFYEKSYQLESGSFLIFKNNKIKIEKYFNLDDYFLNNNFNLKFDKSEFQSILDNSVKSRLVSDAELGIFLSGGIDSSIITYFASKYNSDIKTFTIGFEENSFDESEKATVVANQLKVKNYNFVLNKNDLIEIDKIIYSYGEPLADTSIIPTYFLSKYAKDEVKVCLTGDGGDEMFFGYDTYIASYLYMIFTKFKFDYFFKKLKNFKNLIPQNKSKVNNMYALRKFIETFSENKNGFMVHELWRKINSESSLKKILSENFYDKIQNISTNYFVPSSNIENFNAKNNLCDFKFFLEKDVLVKSDRSSMANSLELRSPFLNIKILEYLSKLSFEERFNPFKKKKIIKSLSKSLLPTKILNQKKRGFNAPVSQWLTNIYFDIFMDYLKSEKSKEFLNIASIENLLIENKKKKVDNGNILFNIFCFLIWINKNNYIL